VSWFTFKGFIFAQSLETNLRASVERCRHRMSSVEPRDYDRPSSALDEVSPKSALGEPETASHMMDLDNVAGTAAAEVERAA
jgi:hypothetical protein